MKVYSCVVVAALAAGAAAQFDYEPMPTRPAVLQKRSPLCEEDSCLQAVQQTDFCTCIRQGKEDCASYFSITITPDTVTEYATTYTIDTSYTTETATLMELISETATTVDEQTNTVTTSVTSTFSLRPTQGKRKRDLSSKEKPKKRGLRKRMPYYAKYACGDEAAYESACACMGVYPGTTDAAASTTTVTTMLPSYSPTETSTATETQSETTTSTQTLTTVATAMATSVVAVAQGPFYIFARLQTGGNGMNGDVSNNYARIGLRAPDADYANMAFDVGDFESASPFYLDTTGRLRSYLRSTTDSTEDDLSWMVPTQVQLGYTMQIFEAPLGNPNGQPSLTFKCSIADGTNELTCTPGTDDGSLSVSGYFRNCGEEWAYFMSGNDCVTSACACLTLVALPYVPALP